MRTCVALRPPAGGPLPRRGRRTTSAARDDEGGERGGVEFVVHRGDAPTNVVSRVVRRGRAWSETATHAAQATRRCKVYAVEWTPTRVTTFIDNRELQTVTRDDATAAAAADDDARRAAPPRRRGPLSCACRARRDEADETDDERDTAAAAAWPFEGPLHLAIEVSVCDDGGSVDTDAIARGDDACAAVLSYVHAYSDTRNRQQHDAAAAAAAERGRTYEQWVTAQRYGRVDDAAAAEDRAPPPPGAEVGGAKDDADGAAVASSAPPLTDVAAEDRRHQSEALQPPGVKAVAADDDEDGADAAVAAGDESDDAGGGRAPPPPPPAPAPAPDVAAISAKPGYRLVWHDEFDYEGLPDERRWSCVVFFARARAIAIYVCFAVGHTSSSFCARVLSPSVIIHLLRRWSYAIFFFALVCCRRRS